MAEPTESKHVLVIDDEKDLREAMMTALSYEGFKVETAENGKEGLTKALTLQPDLIFLDILMPVMDGIEMLKLLRSDPWGKEVPVIVLTAVDSMGKIAEIVEQGSNEYLPKASTTLGKIVERAKAHFKK